MSYLPWTLLLVAVMAAVATAEVAEDTAEVAFLEETEGHPHERTKRAATKEPKCSSSSACNKQWPGMYCKRATKYSSGGCRCPSRETFSKQYNRCLGENGQYRTYNGQICYDYYGRKQTKGYAKFYRRKRDVSEDGEELELPGAVLKRVKRGASKCTSSELCDKWYKGTYCSTQSGKCKCPYKTTWSSKNKMCMASETKSDAGSPCYDAYGRRLDRKTNYRRLYSNYQSIRRRRSG